MSTTSHQVISEPQNKPLCLTKETNRQQKGHNFDEVDETKSDWVKVLKEGSGDVNFSISKSNQLLENFVNNNKMASIKTCKSGSLNKSFKATYFWFWDSVINTLAFEFMLVVFYTILTFMHCK